MAERINAMGFYPINVGSTPTRRAKVPGCVGSSPTNWEIATHSIAQW